MPTCLKPWLTIGLSLCTLISSNARATETRQALTFSPIARHAYTVPLDGGLMLRTTYVSDNATEATLLSLPSQEPIKAILPPDGYHLEGFATGAGPHRFIATVFDLSMNRSLASYDLSTSEWTFFPESRLCEQAAPVFGDRYTACFSDGRKFLKVFDVETGATKASIDIATLRAALPDARSWEPISVRFGARADQLIVEMQGNPNGSTSKEGTFAVLTTENPAVLQYVGSTTRIPGEPLWMYTLSGLPWSVSSDGRTLLVGGDHAAEWDLTSGRKLDDLAGSVRAVWYDGSSPMGAVDAYDQDCNIGTGEYGGARALNISNFGTSQTFLRLCANVKDLANTDELPSTDRSNRYLMLSLQHGWCAPGNLCGTLIWDLTKPSTLRSQIDAPR